MAVREETLTGRHAGIGPLDHGRAPSGHRHSCLAGKVSQGPYGTHNVGNCLRSVPENDKVVQRRSSLSEGFKPALSALLILLGYALIALIRQRLVVQVHLGPPPEHASDQPRCLVGALLGGQASPESRPQDSWDSPQLPSVQVKHVGGHLRGALPAAGPAGPPPSPNHSRRGRRSGSA
jgi:hypothetical protein